MAVLIVAEKTNHQSYRSLTLGREKVNICTLKEAINSIKKRSTKVILLDPGFAIERGLRLLKEIKTLYLSIPVIFIAGKGSEDIVLRAFRSGVRDFFRKPLNIQELQETVTGLLRVKGQSKEKRSPFAKQKDFKTDKSIKSTGTEKINHYIDFLHTLGYIEKNLTEDIDLENLASSACMSKYHFCRLFKKRVGISPIRFVTFMRIEMAKKLLRKDDITISTVAISVGFNDLSSFIAQFKKVTGMTPYIYKKLLHQNNNLKSLLI
jgi:YesN/AraC family two-component response regulator